MELTERPVHFYTKGYRDAVKLYKSAFPKGEQISLIALNLLAVRRNVKFTAFYDEDKLVGILYTIENGKYFFILYLAVNPHIRSRGYGSAILKRAYKKAQGKILVLNVESPDSSAGNQEQRMRRIAFYERNGITDTGMRLTDDGTEYSVLASDTEHFGPEKYKKFLKSL